MTLADGIDFTGRRALITGGSRGLGLAVARQLLALGAEVLLVASDAARLAAAASECERFGGAVDTLAADLATDMGAEEVVLGALARHDHWDFLINCAGVAEHQALENIDLATWHRTLAVNLTAPFILSRGIGQAMAAAGSGRIVNVSSHSGRRPGAGSASYSVSKAGVQMLTQCLATELGPYGVRANAVAPTIFLSEMGRRLWSDPEVARAKQEQIPAKRFAETEEVADLIVYLLTPGADFINGEVIGVDGGLFAGRPRTES